MEFIQISSLENGAHNNFTISGNIETMDGYAIVPESLEHPATFPFVKDIVVEEGVVISWEADQEAYDAAMQAQEDFPDFAPQIQVAMMAFAATSTTIPDSYALDMPDLFPLWEDLLAAGEALAKGTILKDGKQLYRVNQDDVIPQEHQPPHGEGMTAVYVPINRENAGTPEDPIPAVRGMEYTYGLYYLDPEDQRIYLCKRDGEEDGGTVTLQYLPHEQTPHYFVPV